MVQRGEIYYVNLGSNLGSEQSGYRPVLIIQNDTGNKYSPTTIVATLTSKKKKYLPTHVFIKKDSCNGLDLNSTVELLILHQFYGRTEHMQDLKNMNQLTSFYLMDIQQFLLDMQDFTSV